jgi:oligoendopeptidase F
MSTTRWNLDEIKYFSLKKEMQSIENKVRSLETSRKKLTNKIIIKEFISLLKKIEVIRVQTAKLGVYSHLKFCENSTDQKAVAEMSFIENFLTKMGNRLIFFNFWFKQLPEKKVQQLIKESGPYKYHLQLLRKNKKYTLKENEEKIINIKDSVGFYALNNVYNIFTSSFEFSYEGKKRTQEEMVTYIRSPSPKVRENAYKILLVPYVKNKDVLGEIYKNLLNDWREENVALRGFKTPISVRNTANDIPDKAIEVMLKVCEKNQKLFQRFFELKRKKLGLKKMRRFDLYAPLKEEKTKISYEQAIKMVLDTFYSFSKEFGQAAEKIIKNKHIHSKIQKGKRSGAFCCPASTQVLPYVLLNYTNKFRDVSTLAHELGHGVHFVLASNQTEFTHDACLPLAETASIFSEMLLSERIMQTDSKIAKEMMFTKVDDLYASIIRQARFVSFEKKAHGMMEEGKTIDEMSQVYLTDLKKQLGSKISVDNIYAYEWAYIPHIFHTPFYCYAYAFGNLLTLALYEMYKENPQVMVPKIISMLSKGSSESPIEITKAIGVDITSSKFWQKGFDYIEKMINGL